jgi:hypothetical protein
LLGANYPDQLPAGLSGWGIFGLESLSEHHFLHCLPFFESGGEEEHPNGDGLEDLTPSAGWRLVWSTVSMVSWANIRPVLKVM